MADEPRAAERQLSSWKEIAGHFGRDVRTVQRWEKEGLPVHRHPHRSRNSVYAYASELDAWWRGQTPSLASRPPWPRSAAWLTLAATLAAVLGAVSWYTTRDRAGSPSAAGTATWRLRAPYDIVLAADFDGDGRPELAFSATEGPSPQIQRVGQASSGPSEVLVKIEADPDLQVLIASAPDLNGDGIADLLVSTVHLSETAGGTAPAYIVLGRRIWPARLHLPDDADVRLELRMNHDARLGSCDSPTLVDVNRDGLTDILLSAPEFSDGDRSAAGALMVLYGRRTWPPVISLNEQADVLILGSRTGEGLAIGCSVGDWDGDGWPDLAVHAGGHTLWQLQQGRGRTYVLKGGPRWPARIDLSTDFRVRIDSPVDGFPKQRIAMGDVNGDGFADLVRTAPVEDATGVGALHFWMGGDGTGIRTGIDPDVRMTLAPAAAGWARQLTIRDLDADGRDDLVISDGHSASLWLIPGRTAWPSAVTLAEAATRLFTADSETKGYSLVATTVGRGLLDLLLPTGPAGASLHVVPVYETLPFDLRPDAARNLVLVPGPVVVRIAGATTDVSALVPETFRLNGASLTHVRRGDDDHDGRPDLQLYFESRDMTLAGVSRATLVGRRRDGHLVGGSEPIEVVHRAGSNR